MTWRCSNLCLLIRFKMKGRLTPCSSSSLIPSSLLCQLHCFLGSFAATHLLNRPLLFPPCVSSLHPLRCLSGDIVSEDPKGKGQTEATLSDCFVSLHLHLVLSSPTALSSPIYLTSIARLHLSVFCMPLTPSEPNLNSNASYSSPSCAGWDPLGQVMLDEY